MRIKPPVVASLTAIALVNIPVFAQSSARRRSASSLLRSPGGPIPMIWHAGGDNALAPGLGVVDQDVVHSVASFC